MTERDREIVRWIEENKSITIYQCSRIFYGMSKYGYDLARKRLRKLNKDGLINRYRQDPVHETLYYLDKKLKPHNLKLLDVIAYLQEFNINKIIKEHKLEVVGTSYKIDSTAVLKCGNNLAPLLIEIDYTHYTGNDKIENIIRYLEKKHSTVSYFFIVIKSSQREITVEDVGKQSKILWVPWNFCKSDKLHRSLRSLLEEKKG